MVDLFFDIKNITLKVNVLEILLRSGALDGLSDEQANEVIAKDFGIIASQSQLQKEKLLMHKLKFDDKDAVFVPVLYYWLIARKERTYGFEFFDEKECKQNLAKDITKASFPVPVITDKEVWQNDYDYKEMLSKQYFDKAQRFWYKDSLLHIPLSGNGNYLTIALVANELKWSNGKGIPTIDKPTTLEDKDGICILCLPPLYDSCSVNIGGVKYRCFMTSEELALLRANGTVRIYDKEYKLNNVELIQV